MNVASYDNYMLINSHLTFCFFAFFYDNLIAIRCMYHAFGANLFVLVIPTITPKIVHEINCGIAKATKLNEQKLLMTTIRAD